MKILKRPENVIYDTENPNVMVFNPSLPIPPITLSEITLKSDFDFLIEHFFKSENISHPVFMNFSSSYFYCLEV